MHPGRCASVSVAGKTIGYVAEVDPDFLKAALDVPGGTGRVAVFELDADALRTLAGQTRHFQSLPKFPAVTRDLAVVVDTSTPYALVEDAVRSSADTVLLAHISLASLYTGPGIPEGKKSVALHLTFQPQDRTMTEAEIEAQLSAIRRGLADRVGAAER